MNCDTTACPLPQSETGDSAVSSSTARKEDNRRYQVALVTSLAILSALLVFGFYATR